MSGRLMTDPLRAFETLSPQSQAVLLAWILLSVAPSRRPDKATSYSMKHDLEREAGFYVSELELQGAMIRSGHDPLDPSEESWRFRIREAEGRFVGRGMSYSGFGLDEDRLDPVEVGLFRVFSAWARIND